MKSPTPLRRRLLADSALLFATFVWGSTFVMVKDVVAANPPMLFLAARFTLAAVAMALMVTLARRWKGLTLREVGWGALLGFFIWAGYAFQTIGLQWTTASNGGFITGLSVVLVPVFGLFVLKHRPDRWAWAGVVFAALGMALLSLRFESGISINRGDPLIFGCAVAFALQIVLISRYAWRSDPLRLTFVQVLTAAALNFASAALFEVTPGQVALSEGAWAAAAFLGIVATAFAFTAQTTVQRFTTAVRTALIFALEPVFAAIFGVWLQGDSFTLATGAGAALILGGMLIAEIGPQVPGRQAPRDVDDANPAAGPAATVLAGDYVQPD